MIAHIYLVPHDDCTDQQPVSGWYVGSLVGDVAPRGPFLTRAAALDWVEDLGGETL